jgi:hypothetical protein
LLCTASALIPGYHTPKLTSRPDAQPELISASLAHVTHLLWLASHYLAVRLPAELTLPHNDYPRPTVFSLAASYHHGPVAFPGSSPLTPDPRDLHFRHVPHPRPLFIDKTPHTLAKDDPASYNSFIEAVSLLAYNIAWLCRTQGVPVTDNTNGNVDELFHLGRNMYNLLMTSTLPRNNNPSHASDRASDSGGATELGKTAPRMGLYSHGTAHTFLGGAAGNELVRAFKLPNPVKIADRLKSRLLNENPARDWELIENEGGEEALDDGVLVGPRQETPRRAPHFGLESYMSVNTTHGAGDEPNRAAAAKDDDRQKEKGTSGWTKIKPR